MIRENMIFFKPKFIISSAMSVSPKEKFEAAVSIIEGLPKDG